MNRLLPATELTKDHLQTPAVIGPANSQVPVPALALSPQSTLNLPATPAVIQPVSNLGEYLATRQPVAHCEHELPLFMRLPSEIAIEVRALLRSFDLVNSFRRGKCSVTQACVRALVVFSTWNWKLKTYRAKYDLWMFKRDWLVLVNRAKCGGDWIEREAGLPEVFLDYVAKRMGRFGRRDGKRQAILSIQAQWRSGLNPDGQPESIPGYAAKWEERNRRVYPPGWHESNIARQVKARGKFLQAQRLLLHEGESAARAVLPQVLQDRSQLRFLELVTFDDVRVDWLVLVDGQACELWLLVARDEATRMVLGFVMHPATVREDGRAAHLGARHMKQLAGWMLERYPLPPYVVNWKLERGTAGLDEAVRTALGELLGQRIRFSITSMIGSNSSPSGYAEKKKGNSRGKASHESHNRLLHTQGAYIAGQTGDRWDVRPADLPARAGEAVEIWQLRDQLPEHLRGQLQYPILTVNQAREHLFRIFNAQNERTQHSLQGFDEVVERVGDRLVKRMESPIERAARLVRGVQGDWTPVSPLIVTSFYEHTQRLVAVKDNGEISFDVDGKTYTFANAGVPLLPGTKALAYFHPDDPAFAHLTDSRGAMLGTWVRRGLVKYGDEAALAEAMRYTHIAREAARLAANTLAQPQREELAAMRAHNAELLKLSEFTDITTPPEARPATIGAPVGAALTAVSTAVKADKTRAQEHARALRKFDGSVADLVDTPEEEFNPSPKDDFAAEGLL